jgi:hypothetical protein
MEHHVRPIRARNKAVRLGLDLRYPLGCLASLQRGQENGWIVRYREPFVELWRSPVLHAYTLRIEVHKDSQTFTFPESWIEELWQQFGNDLAQHRELVVDLLDTLTGFDTSFSDAHMTGARRLLEVTFSGKARTLQDVDDIAATLRAQVLLMQQGRK